MLGALPDRVEVGHADLVDDAADELRAVAVLRHLGVEAEQPAQEPVEDPDALAPLVERARISATEPMTCGPTPSITTSAWPSSSDITPVTRSRISFCSGVLERVEDAAGAAAADAPRRPA